MIRQFAQDGYDVIFTTSFGYMDPTINVAQDFRTRRSSTSPGSRRLKTSAPASARSMNRASSPANSLGR